MKKAAEKSQQGVSLTTKAVVALCLLLLTANVLLGSVLSRQSMDAMKSLLDLRMLDISNTAAAMMDGDVLGRLQASDKGTSREQALGVQKEHRPRIHLRHPRHGRRLLHLHH